ncbi:MAG: fused MFS/spermidine synthase [Planctomycetes bacterium]|nr:fused MFS/spermidine synthase [Planctomycetota bacterium]
MSADREARSGAGAGAVALRLVAALCAGFGGLVAETVALRRHALGLGSGAAAATWVLGAFLVGLGAGGLLASRLPARLRGVRVAALGYAVVAALVLAGDAVARGLGAVGPFAGAVLVAGWPGLPALAMGLAFPLLFGGLRGRSAPGLLVGANTLGSVGAAWLAGNLLVPEWGLRASAWLAAASYATAAGSAWLGAGSTPRGDRERPRATTGALRLAAVAGFVMLGYEVLLLRRLPFFLEGFQPTLAGVLACCLLFAALGAFAGRLFAGAHRGPAVAVAAAGVAIACGAVERFAPGLGRLPVDDDLGLHLRVLATAAVPAALPCFLCGAVVPALLARAAPSGRDALAGALFCAQGLGALAGSLAVGWLAPWCAPGSFFVVAPLGLAAVALVAVPGPRLARLGAVAAVVVAGLLGLTGAGTPGAPRSPIDGSRNDRPGALRTVAFRTDPVTTATVALDRRDHGMVLFTDEFRAAETGPGTSYMRLLGHLPLLLREHLERAAVIALGTGTTAAAVVEWPDPATIDVVEISPAVLSLCDLFGGDGPVSTGEPAPFRADPRTRTHAMDGRRWLARQPAGSLHLVTMEPLLPYAPGTTALYSREFYALARSRLAPGGLAVQWVPTHAMPVAAFETLLATFGDAFPCTSVWLVDQSTLLVGSDAPHLPDALTLARRLSADAPPAARRTLHEAGIARVDDLRAAFVGSGPFTAFAGARRLCDDQPFLEHIGYWSGEARLGFLAGNLERLAALATAAPFDSGGVDWPAVRTARLAGRAAGSLDPLDPGGTAAQEAARRLAALRIAAPGSVLLQREETLALRALMRREVERADARTARALARAQLRRDPGDAELWLAASTDDGTPTPEAIDAALALDPTLIDRPGRYRAAIRALRSDAPPSPLADLARLPEGASLAAAVARDGARAAVYRAAFPVRCALALCGVARERPLSAAEQSALAPLLDPASFDALCDGVMARGGDPNTELLPLWRRDLAPGAVLVDLARDPDPARRSALAEALGGRRDAPSRALLADLLEDVHIDVRRTAAVALQRTTRGSVAYDPQWPAERRSEAAAKLRGGG